MTKSPAGGLLARWSLAGSVPRRARPRHAQVWILHHLQICGRDTPLFTDDSVALVHQVSRGYPRTINNICRQALLAGRASRKTLPDDTIVRTAISEVITPDD